MGTEDQKYQNARRRVESLKSFYIHLGVYVLVNAFLFVLNITTSPDVLWFYWPLSGWGIGVAMHAVFVFGIGRWFGSDWEEKKNKELME